MSNKASGNGNAPSKSADTSPKIHKADGETVNDETTYVKGHDGQMYTSAAYALSDEAKGVVKEGE